MIWLDKWLTSFFVQTKILKLATKNSFDIQICSLFWYSFIPLKYYQKFPKDIYHYFYHYHYYVWFYKTNCIIFSLILILYSFSLVLLNSTMYFYIFIFILGTFKEIISILRGSTRIWCKIWWKKMATSLGEATYAISHFNYELRNLKRWH